MCAMVATGDEQTDRNRVVQVELYGEPLGESFRRISETLGLTQARLASVIGLSAPMLSQLMSGRRAKIGHPMVVQRVQALHELAEDVVVGRVTPEVLRARLDEIQQSTGAAFTGGSLAGGSLVGGSSAGASSATGAPTAGGADKIANPGGPPVGPTGLEPRTAVHTMQSMLRAVAGADELLAAVRTLQPTHPELAEFLRIYGAGRTSEAVQHYERIRSEL